MTRLRTSSILVFVLCFSGLRSQITLDYNSFLALIKKESLLAKKANNNKAFAQFQYKASQGGFDPQLNSEIENKFFTSTDYFTVSTTELKQAIYTSQSIKLGYQYGQGLFTNPENSTPVAGLPYVGIQASLLQGLLFDKNRAEVIKGKHYREYYNAEEKIQLNDLLFVSLNSYCDYLYSKKVNSIYSYFSSLAQQRLRGITDLSVIGERPFMDTVEAAIFMQGRILDVKASEVDLTKNGNGLLVFIQGTNFKQNGFLTTDSMDFVYNSIKQKISLKAQNQNSTNPLISQYSAKQRVLETEARLKKEMIKPVLDVNYNFLYNNYVPSAPNLTINNYKWGARFSMPLFLRRSRNDYKLANIMVDNNRLELDYKQAQIDFKRKYLLDAILVVSQQIVNAERSSAYSKVLLEAEKTKFNNGESSLFLLNSRENKWLETELKLVEYKLKYIKMFLELTYVDGGLVYELN